MLARRGGWANDLDYDTVLYILKEMVQRRDLRLIGLAVEIQDLAYTLMYYVARDLDRGLESANAEL